jgi:pyrrolysine biosynthesis protein PylC
MQLIRQGRTFGNMVRLLIIGAKLQGVEALYLARKAGYYAVAVDRNADAPGIRLADEFVVGDVFHEDVMLPLFRAADAVLPAVEDIDVLRKIETYGEKTGTPVLFDSAAYGISCSKEKSNRLFAVSGLPVPGAYPECDYPVILKPDGQSGSKNVKKAFSPDEVEAYLAAYGGQNTVIQEYLHGPSYSLEVLGDGERYFFPQITEVITDRGYDCKRVIAPAQLTPAQERQMLKIGQSLAQSLQIKGIFDIEVISHNGQLKLLEIDARLPSQTPISVYHSTGMNMVEMMVELALGSAKNIRVSTEKQVCVYQQIEVGGGQIRVLGEHIMSECRALRIREGFYGCTAAITDYEEGRTDWRAIVIVTGADRHQAIERFLSFVARVKKGTGIENWDLVEG